ncbi:MAG: hypothetical protein AABZ55_13395, partial [Bdellovibrionota bacterium]
MANQRALKNAWVVLVTSIGIFVPEYGNAREFTARLIEKFSGVSGCPLESKVGSADCKDCVKDKERQNQPIEDKRNLENTKNFLEEKAWIEASLPILVARTEVYKKYLNELSTALKNNDPDEAIEKNPALKSEVDSLKNAVITSAELDYQLWGVKSELHKKTKSAYGLGNPAFRKELSKSAEKKAAFDLEVAELEEQKKRLEDARDEVLAHNPLLANPKMDSYVKAAKKQLSERGFHGGSSSFSGVEARVFFTADKRAGINFTRDYSDAISETASTVEQRLEKWTALQRDAGKLAKAHEEYSERLSKVEKGEFSVNRGALRYMVLDSQKAIEDHYYD